MTVCLLTAYWLLRVAREARWGFVPHVAWWAVPGVLLLLLTPVLDVPALFGVGAGLLLLAEFWPRAYVPLRSRPGRAWPLVGLITGGVLALAVIRSEQVQSVATFVAMACLLAGTAGLLVTLLLPRRPARVLGFEARWKVAVTPEWPDLSVSLSATGAHLKNVSRGTLRVAGWSPAGVNAWYRLRGEDGRAMNVLQAGQTAFLPWTTRTVGCGSGTPRTWPRNHPSVPG
ncbi:hypothetical protein ACFSC4_05790 [Deinococcus malanensis]|uniref:hypothetical protein n=1 Tax=Deinococcus malanensis TaxID=1706855 RepID=UPI00364189A7